jgi:uncharacterized membrane protein YdjX (TVP38/TMEM64 family)
MGLAPPSLRVRAPGRAARAARLALGAAAILAAVLLARTLDTPALLQAALERVHDLGAWGPLLFVALYVAASVLLLPAVILTLGAGALFGVALGIPTVSAGATLGATVAFLVGRHLARGWVARRLAGVPALRALDAAAVRDGWKLVLLTRLSPAFPFILLNYALALTAVPLRQYVLASWAGMLPGIATYVYLGAVAGDLATLGAGAAARTPAGWALYGVGLLATLAVTVQVTRLARRALRERLAEPAP